MLEVVDFHRKDTNIVRIWAETRTKGGDETAKPFPGNKKSQHEGPEAGDAGVTGEARVEDL